MENRKIILYTSFTADNKYFALGTRDGCTIYSTNPLQKGFELGKSKEIKFIIIYFFFFFSLKENFLW